MWFRNRAENQKSNPLICRRPVQLGPPTLRNICLKIVPKVRQLEKNGYIALTQPHVDKLRSNFRRWYSIAPGKFRNCQKPLRVESKMSDDTRIFNIRAPISLKRQNLETSTLVCAPMTMSSFDGMQNTRWKGTWLSLDDPDLNLRNPANISQTAKTIGFKFITQIDYREWKISSTKVGRSGTLSRSQWPTLRFCHFFYISVTTTATDFKYGAHSAYRE